MFKEFLIVDSILDSPEVLVRLSKQISYDVNKIPIGKALSDISFSKDRTFGNGGRNWFGYRSNFLYEINYDLFSSIFNEIFSKVFSHYKFSEINYYVDAHLHFLPQSCQGSDEDYHRDTSVMAGVIYLNKDPAPESGTVLILPNENCCRVENKFNRLVLYNADILHRPQNGFGSRLDDCRLTLTFFVRKLEIKS